MDLSQALNQVTKEMETTPAYEMDSDSDCIYSNDKEFLEEIATVNSYCWVFVNSPTLIHYTGYNYRIEELPCFV